MPIWEEAGYITNFLMPWGRYKYCKKPQGHRVAGDAQTTRYDKTTQVFGRMERCVDNIILWDHKLEENFKATELIAKKETTTNLATIAMDATPN